MSCPIVSPTTYTWPLGHESILTLWEGSKHIHFGARKIEIETLFPIPKDQLDNLLASCVVKPYINELLFKEAGFNFLCQLSTENPEITQIQNCYEQRKQLFNRCIADTDAALAGYKVKRIFLDDIEWNYKEKLYDEISYTNCKKYYHYSFRISGFCYPNTISFSATKELKSRAQQDILKILDHLYSEEASFEEKRKQQAVLKMHETIIENLKSSFYNSEEMKLLEAHLKKELYNGTITSYKAAWNMLNKYFRK